MIQTRKVGDPIRQPSAPLVKHHHPGIAREAKQPTRHIRSIPPMLDVSKGWRSENDVERAFAEYLIGDVNVAALGVPGLRLH